MADGSGVHPGFGSRAFRWRTPAGGSARQAASFFAPAPVFPQGGSGLPSPKAAGLLRNNRSRFLGSRDGLPVGQDGSHGAEGCLCGFPTCYAAYAKAGHGPLQGFLPPGAPAFSASRLAPAAEGLPAAAALFASRKAALRRAVLFHGGPFLKIRQFSDGLSGPSALFRDGHALPGFPGFRRALPAGGLLLLFDLSAAARIGFLLLF